MSDLIVVAFKGEDTADQVLNKLLALQERAPYRPRWHLCRRSRPTREGHLKQAVNLVGVGAASGGDWDALWGTLIGLLFLNLMAGLLTGAAVGAGAGALSGALTDYGIDDDFIRSLGATLAPGASALFVLVRRATRDKVLPELRPFGGTILRTWLSHEQEERLRQALEEITV
jgi:uncharacterized membrane protein